MGLLKHLLFWPVTGPLFLTRFSLDRVGGVVREQLTDDSEIKSELMALQLALELGDIDDDEYVRREAELMARLRDVRAWREEFGLGVAGGPVRVAGAERSAGAPASAEAAEAAEAADAAAREPRPEAPPAADGTARVDIELGWE